MTSKYKIATLEGEKVIIQILNGEGSMKFCHTVEEFVEMINRAEEVFENDISELVNEVSQKQNEIDYLRKNAESQILNELSSFVDNKINILGKEDITAVEHRCYLEIKNYLKKMDAWRD